MIPGVFLLWTPTYAADLKVLHLINCKKPAMKSSKYNRRKFIRSATAATSAAGLLSVFPKELLANNGE